jgi:hypothetical protein
LCAAIEFVDDDLIEKLYIKILNHLVEELPFIVNVIHSDVKAIEFGVEILVLAVL